MFVDTVPNRGLPPAIFTVETMLASKRLRERDPVLSLIVYMAPEQA